VRFRAGEALVRLGKDGIRQLKIAAQNGDPMQQRSATLVLAENDLYWTEPSGDA
jgi:hypothetical protein